MSATGALIEMTAKCGGATPRNGQQHFAVLPADPLAASFDKSSSRGAVSGNPPHCQFLAHGTKTRVPENLNLETAR